MIKTILEDFGARIECNNQQQGLRVAGNARAISEISDLLSGLSLQLNQLMADKIKKGNSGPNILTEEETNHSPGSKSVNISYPPVLF